MFKKISDAVTTPTVIDRKGRPAKTSSAPKSSRLPGDGDAAPSSKRASPPSGD